MRIIFWEICIVSEYSTGLEISEVSSAAWNLAYFMICWNGLEIRRVLCFSLRVCFVGQNEN